MSESFRGELIQKVDNKARVSIPAAFRRVLQEGDPKASEKVGARVVIVYGGPGRKFAECYTYAGSEDLANKIALHPEGSRERINLTNNLITKSAIIELDLDGRLVLPPQVRQKIGVTPDDLTTGFDAVFAGTLTTFQIWKRDVYDAETATLDQDGMDSLDGALDILALLHRPAV